MYHLSLKHQQICQDHKATWRTMRISRRMAEDGTVIQEGGLRVCIEDAVTGQMILEQDVCPCSPETEEQAVESVVDLVPATEAPLTPAQMAQRLAVQESELEQLRALKDKKEKKPAWSADAARALTTKLMDAGLTPPRGIRNTHSWRDKAQAMLEEHEQREREVSGPLSSEEKAALNHVEATALKEAGLNEDLTPISPSA
jgi:hypothetical protein|tara:strand:+ start:1427 stop:2026 length:600 start_codon:yes stop_codon:yes gene_type:complete